MRQLIPSTERPLPYSFDTNSGIVTADTSTIQTSVESEYQTIFGADLDLTPSTPQGQLINRDVETQSSVLLLLADFANQINPNLAGGIFLDAICALSGIQRIVATNTEVIATITGASGTIIPAGSLATTTTGYDFQILATTTIPSSGSINATFQAVTAGAIACASGTLTTIKTGIVGWETITNSSDGVIGHAIQTDSNLRKYRNNTLASQAKQTTEAVQSAVLQVQGVTSLSFLENNSSSTTVISGITLVAHSIWVCVYGGSNADVATAIYNNRSAGCAFNGSQSYSITTSSGQSIAVLFDRATVVPILCKITVKVFQGYSATSAQIQNAVANYAFEVGKSVSPFSIAGEVSTIGGVYVQLCQVALASDGIYQATELPMAINQIAYLSPSSIQVIFA